jgi:ABC-type transporter MlaC component
MKSISIRLTGILLLIFAITTPLSAGVGEKRINELITAFKNYNPDSQNSSANIESILNLDFMAKHSMNFYWDKMTDSEKKEFASIFKKLVEKLAYKKSRDYFRNNKYTLVKETTGTAKDYLFSSQKESVKLVTVTVSVDYKAGTGIKKENVVFHLIQQPQGLIVFDVELLDGSLVKDYRNQFSKNIREKGGVSGLIKVMNDKYNEK